ncbi:MAG: hypothetical protein WD059_11300 [Balneolaceae bacterium]
MHSIFGEIEISKQANQRGKHLARLLTINLVQELRNMVRRILHDRFSLLEYLRYFYIPINSISPASSPANNPVGTGGRGDYGLING